MPALDDTYSYPSSPPELGLPDLVIEELLPRESIRSEMNADQDQWLPLGVDSYLSRPAPPQSGIYTLPATEGPTEEHLDGAQQRIPPGAHSPTASDRYRRSDGPSPELHLPISSWQPEMPLPQLFASPAPQDEMDESSSAVPAGTLRPWSKCGWVPNENEPEPDLAEFFNQHRILSLSPPPVPHDIAEFSFYVDYSHQIAPIRPPSSTSPAPSSADTVRGYVLSDNEHEGNRLTLPGNAQQLFRHVSVQRALDDLPSRPLS